MNKWLSLLVLLLSVSIALNIYLLSRYPTHDVLKPSVDEQTKVNKNKPSAALFNQTHFDQLADETNKTLTHEGLESSREKMQTQLWETKRVELLAQAQLWLQQKKLLTLGTFLQDYLKRHPQDMDFLLIEAHLKVQTSLLSDAIAHYYDLLRNPLTPAQKSEIEQQIEQLSTNTIEQLKRNYSWDVLAMFVEPLLQLEPNNRLYILSLSKAYAELYQEGLMENVLASLDFDDPDAQNIRKIILAQQITPHNDGVSDLDINETTADLGRPIPLIQFGDQYVVEAVLSSNPVALLIDTGASVTAVSKEYFDNLSNRYKVNYLGRFSIGTAGGSIMASMYQFRELTIQHVTVQNLPVVILPMQSINNADGLLGMNFLREFDFKIDQRQSVIFIK